MRGILASEKLLSIKNSLICKSSCKEPGAWLFRACPPTSTHDDTSETNGPRSYPVSLKTTSPPGNPDAFLNQVPKNQNRNPQTRIPTTKLANTKTNTYSCVFRRIVGSHSGSSWAPISVPHEQLEPLMLEQLHTGQTLWPPLSLREETNIDVSPEGLHASGQRSPTFNGCGP